MWSWNPITAIPYIYSSKGVLSSVHRGPWAWSREWPCYASYGSNSNASSSIFSDSYCTFLHEHRHFLNNGMFPATAVIKVCVCVGGGDIWSLLSLKPYIQSRHMVFVRLVLSIKWWKVDKYICWLVSQSVINARHSFRPSFGHKLTSSSIKPTRPSFRAQKTSVCMCVCGCWLGWTECRDKGKNNFHWGEEKAVFPADVTPIELKAYTTTHEAILSNRYGCS